MPARKAMLGGVATRSPSRRCGSIVDRYSDGVMRNTTAGITGVFGGPLATPSLSLRRYQFESYPASPAIPGCNSRSPVRTPIPSLYRRSWSHCGAPGWAVGCDCALAARDTSRATTTAEDARPLVVIGTAEGTPLDKQSYSEMHNTSQSLNAAECSASTRTVSVTAFPTPQRAAAPRSGSHRAAASYRPWADPSGSAS